MTDSVSSRAVRVLSSIVHFPLTRIVIALVVVAAAMIGTQIAVGRLAADLSVGAQRWIATLGAILLVHFVYLGYVRLLERRSAREVALRGAAAETGLGALVAAGMMTLLIGWLWLLGLYEVLGTGSVGAIVPALAISMTSGYVEEVMFRGIIFRITEGSLGSWIALGISAAVFGLAHIANPNATFVSSVAITIEAGVLLGAAYMVTRRLWMAVGMHFAWNLTQGGIFGVRVSGNDVGGLIRSRMTGPEILSGGSFGAEASIFAIAISLGVGVYLLRLSIARAHVVRPFWKRDTEE